LPARSVNAANQWFAVTLPLNAPRSDVSKISERAVR
jgi:hypothetical protein